ncbi:uracil-DNA glycosylase [Rhodoferax bucti]|uniref:uracil-DNA glycosylase n=1 Tax=Rhodoferax bucti TaxID=2576305 RepID=UPI001107EF88|nr:uracil-DNA glycosylase [Rhodoferax bucti]
MQFSLLSESAGDGVTAGASGQLTSADPPQWPVDASWSGVKEAFFSSVAGQQLLAFLKARLEAGAVVFPPQPLRMLALTPLPEVRVVILGQDPYHGRGQAEGLAFSVAQGVAIPPSLRNIFKELAREGAAAQALFPVTTGSLLPWAKQGVLLLNTCLTVEEGLPASHARQGWEVLTDCVIRAVSASAHPVVFMLWGAHAQSKRPLIDEGRHLVLMANHPSPLSASRPPVPFVGCGHFSQAAHWLRVC